MKTYTQDELNEIVRNHRIWLDDNDLGTWANLAGANLAGANLREANLRGADLAGANLAGANLREANLRGADLVGANLAGADLREANLRGADLAGANLREANLRESNLRESNGRDINTIVQVSGIGSARRMTTYWAEEDKVWCGCFTGTLAEFEAKVEKTHGDSKHGRNYRAAIAFFKVAGVRE